MSLGLLVSSLPWWIAAPLIQLAVLVIGIALDETYVNRTTIVTGSIATHIHIFVAGDVGVLVALYADLGLIVGFYGLYAYVIDGYVGNWFRLLAYYVYSPLSVFLVILTAGPTVFGVEPFVVPALVGAGYANYQFREYLRPEQPFYFGPRTHEEFEAVIETETITGTPETDHPPDATAERPTSSAGSDGGPGTVTAETTDPSPEDAAAGSAAPETGTEPAASDGGSSTGAAARSPSETQRAESDSFDEPDVSGDDSGFEHPGAEPAAAADSSERGILPKFMRRL